MAKLPSEFDLARRPAPTGSGAIRVAGLDYGPIAGAGRAIADGVGSVVRAGVASLDAENEIEDYDTRRKMLDFRLKTEIEHEEFKRSMPPGGGDYSAQWEKVYSKRAKEFVGKDDANIPATMRGKVGMALKQHEVMLSERAQRAELAERDRFELEGLSSSLEDRKALVFSSPNQVDRFKTEALDMIESNPRLSPAAKAKLRKTFIPGLIEEAYRGRAASAKSVDEYKAILDELKPDMRDTGVGVLSDQYVEGIKQSEGFTPKATWDYKQNSNGYGTKAKFPGEVIDKAEAEKRFADEIGKAAAIVDKFAPDIDEGTRAALVSLTFNAGSKWTTAGLGQAIKSGDMEKARQLFLEYNKAGGDTLPGLAERRRKEAQWIGAGGSRPAVADQTAPAYDGPHPELSQKQRRHLYNAVRDEQNKAFAGLHAQMKAQLADDVESVRRTGKGSTALDVDFTRKVLNPNQMRNWEIERKEAEYEYQMMGGLERLTPDAIADKIQRVKPEPGDESYKAHSKAIDKAIKFAGDLQKMRENDPAGAVDAGPLVRIGNRTIEADPDVQKARESKTGPHAIMAARLKAQEKIGIPPESQSPITKDEAKRLLAPLAGLKGDDLAKPLSELARQVQTDYREYAPAVMRYIARTLYHDKASQEVVSDELSKMMKAPGAMVLDPRKLKELERIDQTEMMRRAPAKPSEIAYPRPNQAQIKMLIDNPHFAADFSRKFGDKLTAEILKAAGQQ